jgi:hypothetical protein
MSKNHRARALLAGKPLRRERSSMPVTPSVPHRGPVGVARLPRPTPQPPLHPTQTPLSLSPPPYSVILSEGAHSLTVSTGVEGPRRSRYHPNRQHLSHPKTPDTLVRKLPTPEAHPAP